MGKREKQSHPLKDKDVFKDFGSERWRPGSWVGFFYILL